MNGKLKQLQREYAIQDNRGTAFPIYVTVQELKRICIVDAEYVNCSDSEIISKWLLDCSSDEHNSYEEAVSVCEEMYIYPFDEEVDEIIEAIERIEVLYMWTDVEFFLTIKAAEDFMKSNAHNMGRTRTYVKHFHRRNFEMRELLKLTGFRTED